MKHRCTSSESTSSGIGTLLSNDGSVSSLSFNIRAILLLEVGRHTPLAENENLALAPGRLCVLSCEDVEDQEAGDKSEENTNVSIPISQTFDTVRRKYLPPFVGVIVFV